MKLMRVVCLVMALVGASARGSVFYDSATTTWMDLPFNGTGGPVTLTVRQFDSSLGILTGIMLTLRSYVQADVTVENLADVQAPTTMFFLMSSINGTATGGQTINLAMNPSYGPKSLAPSDHVVGSGLDFWNIGHLSASNRGTANIADFTPYVGTGTVNFDVMGIGGYNVFGTSSSQLNIENFQGRGDLTVAYSYTKIDEPPMVPEPSTLSYLAMAGGCLYLIRRRRMNASKIQSPPRLFLEDEQKEQPPTETW